MHGRSRIKKKTKIMKKTKKKKIARKNGQQIERKPEVNHINRYVKKKILSIDNFVFHVCALLINLSLLPPSLA